jgi:preprotein translocase subunit SecE
MFARIGKFFGEARTELRHVNWPTREEAIRLTLIVIGMSVILAAFLGAFDYLFTFLIRNFILQ